MEWVYCPICKNKTRTKIRKDTELINFPLFCPKCKQESVINVTKQKITVVEPDAKTLCFYIITGRTSPPNKKNGAFGGLYCHA